MQRRIGNIWSEFKHTDLLLITTNSTIVSGKLVMGAGIAKQASIIYPHLSTWAADEILKTSTPNEYGLIIPQNFRDGRDHRVGLFQTKTQWREDSKLNLIKKSTMMLVGWCKKHPDVRVDMNFPGIGFGRLREEDVLPVISSLPDQVYVWTLPKGPVV